MEEDDISKIAEELKEAASTDVTEGSFFYKYLYLLIFIYIHIYFQEIFIDISKLKI